MRSDGRQSRERPLRRPSFLAGQVSDGYTREQVRQLIGLREHPGPGAPRHLTFLDLLSLIRSPGGDPLWRSISRTSTHAEDDWSDLVSLAPDSTLACVLWDFLRAMKRVRSELSLTDYAILSLTVMGWTPRDVASVLWTNHGGRPRHPSKSTIENRLHGYPNRTRDARGSERVGGIVNKMFRAMGAAREEV